MNRKPILHEVLSKTETKHSHNSQIWSNLLISICSAFLEVQVLLPLLELCQTLSAASDANLAAGIVRGLEDALPLVARKETSLHKPENKCN